jgi:hypothetical protein
MEVILIDLLYICGDSRNEECMQQIRERDIFKQFVAI